MLRGARCVHLHGVVWQGVRKIKGESRESQRTVRAGRDVREALKRNGAMRMPRLAETTGAMAQANRSFFSFFSL